MVDLAELGAGALALLGAGPKVVAPARAEDRNVLDLRAVDSVHGAHDWHFACRVRYRANRLFR